MELKKAPTLPGQRRSPESVSKGNRQRTWDAPQTSSAGAKAQQLNVNINIKLAPDKLKLKHVAWMAEKLAKTQKAGLSTHRALGTLARTRPKDVLGKRLQELQDKMSEGRSLGSAMRDREREYGPLACALVDAGEASGSLERSLAKVADLSNSRLRLQRKVKGAMVYPMAVIIITTVLIAAMLFYVVPQFAGIYSEAGGQLPAMTQFIMMLSKYAPFVFGGFALLVTAVIVTFKMGRTRPRLKLFLDTWKVKVPLIGKLLEQAAHARVAATLANLMAAGVPLLTALDYAAQVAADERISQGLHQVKDMMSEGATFSQALDAAGVFPDLLVQLAAVGEESGSLPELMESYAQNAEDEVETSADALTSAIEPIMMIVIGGVVGVFLLGLYMPMLDIGDQIK